MAHSQATIKEKSCPPARATPALVFGAALLAPQPRSIPNSEMTGCQNSKEIVAFPYCTIAFWGFAKGGHFRGESAARTTAPDTNSNFWLWGAPPIQATAAPCRLRLCWYTLEFG